jgi:hypothetical protein
MRFKNIKEETFLFEFAERIEHFLKSKMKLWFLAWTLVGWGIINMISSIYARNWNK